MGKIVKKVGDNKFEVKVAASEEGQKYVIIKSENLIKRIQKNAYQDSSNSTHIHIN